MCQLPHIAIKRDIWPLLAQHMTAERLNLAKGDCPEPSCPLETQRKAADAREQIQHRKLVTRHCLANKD
jgi:hypothetical protein